MSNRPFEIPPVFALHLSEMTQIGVTGADRLKILQGFCTNDLRPLTPGQGCEAFLTNHQGKTIGHLLIGCEADRFVVQTVPGQAEKIITHLDRFIITEDVVLTDETAEYSHWLVGGTGIAELFQTANIPLPSQPLSTTTTTELTIRSVPYLATGYLVSALAKNSSAVQTWLKERGIPLVSPSPWTTGLRIEASWPLFGSDITDDNLPQEIDRNEQAISFKKGCYLGQETVARLDALGHVNRILRRIKLPCPIDQLASLPGSELIHDGKAVGKITSAGWSPKLEAVIAFALVRTSAAKPGTMLSLQDQTAEVLPLKLDS